MDSLLLYHIKSQLFERQSIISGSCVLFVYEGTTPKITNTYSTYRALLDCLLGLKQELHLALPAFLSAYLGQRKIIYRAISMKYSPHCASQGAGA